MTRRKGLDTRQRKEHWKRRMRFRRRDTEAGL